jgi:hypothetical protein
MAWRVTRRRNLIENCKFCRESFFKDIPTKVFCSDRCRYAYHNARKLEAMRIGLEEMKCREAAE